MQDNVQETSTHAGAAFEKITGDGGEPPTAETSKRRLVRLGLSVSMSLFGRASHGEYPHVGLFLSCPSLLSCVVWFRTCSVM